MATTPFEHSPLDPADPNAIQILELLPSPSLKGPIHCELYHRSLDEDVQYEALSYTWGVPEPGHTVLVNGPHTLDVTPNCLEALKSLRRRFHRRSLWVDAICIDQREDDRSKRERSHQIKIMGDIYRKAQKVLIWLGPEEPTTARTIARLKLIVYLEARLLGFSPEPIASPKLIAKLETRLLRNSRVRYAVSILKEYLSKRMIDPLGPEPSLRYQAFRSMICSPWWQRVWTLQEQALARQCEAHHGRRSIPFFSLQPDELRAVVECLTNEEGRENHQSRWRIGAPCRPHQESRALERPLGYRENLKGLLEMPFLLESKNPIDKIFGLYSILTAYGNLSLSAPDYDKTAEEVYEETAWAWISTQQDLSILRLAARPNLVHKLPSWVPAWHQRHPKYTRKGGPPQPGHFGSAHFDWNYLGSGIDVRRSLVPVARVLSPGKLHILGARFAGKVSHTIGLDKSNKHENSRLHFTDVLYVHLDWCRLIRDVFFHSAGEIEEALREMFRSIVYAYIPSHREDEDVEEPFGEELFEPFREWFDFMLYLDEESWSHTSLNFERDGADRRRDLGVMLYHDVVWADDEKEATNALESRYNGYVQGRRGLARLARDIRTVEFVLRSVRHHSLCILDNDNMIAITDYWCQEGDEIFVFPGTDSTFVLRKAPDEDGYRLIGPALVDCLLRYRKWRSRSDGLQDIVLI